VYIHCFGSFLTVVFDCCFFVFRVLMDIKVRWKLSVFMTARRDSCPAVQQGSSKYGM